MKRLRSVEKKESSAGPHEQADRTGRDLTPLSEILQSLFNDPSLPLNPEDHRIWQVWDGVVGPAVARNARPSWIRNKRLRVRVSGPIWLQELEFVAETIRNRLNEALGRQAIDRIDFRLGDPNAPV